MMHETMDTLVRNDVLELTGASSLTARRFRPLPSPGTAGTDRSKSPDASPP